MKSRRADSYAGFADLARSQIRGTDYEIEVQRRPASPVAIIAPHGGRIERGTSEIARMIAGEQFNLYLFEGIRASGNFGALHLTSRRFDEPCCLGLIAHCSVVVAVHGCKGKREEVLLGGLDQELKGRLSESLGLAGVHAQTQGHRYPATDPNNICNRGRLKRGVQLELSARLRGSPTEQDFVRAVRSVLLSLVTI